MWDFSRDVMKLIEDSIDGYMDKINNKAEEVAKKTVKKIREESPRRITRKGGKYAKSWTSDKNEGAITEKSEIWEVFSDPKRKQWGLVHLLERGHAVANGTRRFAVKTTPQPHFGPAEEYAQKEFTKEVTKIING